MNDKEELLKLGQLIKKAREKNNLSQEKLANILGRDQPTINRIERGRVNTSYLFLLEISNALNISISKLLKQED